MTEETTNCPFCGSADIDLIDSEEMVIFPATYLTPAETETIMEEYECQNPDCEKRWFVCNERYEPEYVHEFER